jgi:hypothetical protein
MDDQPIFPDYPRIVAPESINLEPDDHVILARGAFLPLTVVASGVPGAKERIWTSISAETFLDLLPVAYSFLIRMETPVEAKAKFTAGRTVYEGILSAMAQKFGRTPSLHEQSQVDRMQFAEARVTEGDALYKVCLLLAIYCSNDQVKIGERKRRELEGKLRQILLQPQRFYYEPIKALRHLQPGGLAFPVKEPPALFEQEALALIPRLSCPKFPADDAVWIGRHLRERTEVFYSFKYGLTSQPIPTSLITILGGPGEGKTYLMRSILVQRLLMGRTVVTIDPEGENNKFCKALGGTVIPANIPEDPNTCLMHPLTGTLSPDNTNYPAQVLENLLFVLKLVHGESPITPGVENLLGMAIMKIWLDRHDVISFSDLVEKCATISSPDVFVAISLLQPYAQGGINSGFFDRPNALLSPDFEAGTWINFDLSQMQAESKSKIIVYIMLAAFLRDAVTVGQNPMDIFIDEGWVLLRTKVFRDMLDELGRRARKRDVAVVLTTHLPSDFLKYETSMNLATNSFIGHMEKSQALGYLDSLGVPPEKAAETAAIISNLKPYEFIAVPAGFSTLPFPVRVLIPSTWLTIFEKYKKTKA